MLQGNIYFRHAQFADVYAVSVFVDVYIFAYVYIQSLYRANWDTLTKHDVFKCAIYPWVLKKMMANKKKFHICFQNISLYALLQLS